MAEVVEGVDPAAEAAEGAESAAEVAEGVEVKVEEAAAAATFFPEDVCEISDEEQAAFVPAAEAPEDQADPMETALLVMGLDLNALSAAPVSAWPGLVQRAYRKRSVGVHPDKGGGDAEMFESLTSAKEWLLQAITQWQEILPIFADCTAQCFCNHVVARSGCRLCLQAKGARGHSEGCPLTSITNYFLRRSQDKRFKGTYFMEVAHRGEEQARRIIKGRQQIREAENASGRKKRCRLRTTGRWQRQCSEPETGWMSSGLPRTRSSLQGRGVCRMMSSRQEALQAAQPAPAWWPLWCLPREPAAPSSSPSGPELPAPPGDLAVQVPFPCPVCNRKTGRWQAASNGRLWPRCTRFPDCRWRGAFRDP